MTEKEKMLKGFMYDTSDSELVRLRRIARNMAQKFNATTEDEIEQRENLLKEILAVGNPCQVIRPITEQDKVINYYEE